MSTKLSTTQGTPPARVERAIKGERSSRRLDAHLKAAALSLATTVVVAVAVLGGAQSVSAATYNSSVGFDTGAVLMGGVVSSDGSGGYYIDFTQPTISSVESVLTSNAETQWNQFYDGNSGSGFTVLDMSTLHYNAGRHLERDHISSGDVAYFVAHFTDGYFGITGNVSALWNGYYHIDFTDWSVEQPSIPDNTTRIISHDPDNHELVSATTTSLTLTVEGYINDDDYVDGMWVDLYTDNGCVASSQLVGPIFAFTQKSCPAGGALVSGLQSWTFYATTSGAFSFSTTSNAEVVGSYDMVSAIRKPWLSILGFNIGKVTFDEYKTIFTVSTTTAFDVLRADTRNEMDAFFGTATSSEAVRGICNPISGSFSLGVCVSFLFAGGSTGEWATKVQAQMDDTIRRWPFGYVTLVVDALKNPNTDDADLPSITLDFSSLGIPATSASPDVELDPWSVFASSSLLSTAEDPKTHQTLRELIEPGLTGFIYLLFTLMVFLELVGFSMSTIQRGPSKNID